MAPKERRQVYPAFWRKSANGQNSPAYGRENRVQLGGRTQLPAAVTDVIPDRVIAESQSIRDLRGSPAQRDQPQHLQFPQGQRPGILRWRCHPGALRQGGGAVSPHHILHGAGDCCRLLFVSGVVEQVRQKRAIFQDTRDHHGSQSQQLPLARRAEHAEPDWARRQSCPEITNRSTPVLALRGKSSESQPREDFVASLSQDFPAPMPKNTLGSRVPKQDDPVLRHGVGAEPIGAQQLEDIVRAQSSSDIPAAIRKGNQMWNTHLSSYLSILAIAYNGNVPPP